MHRYGIEDEAWFEAVRTGLERRGFRLRVQQRSIVIEMDGRLPRIVGDARAFLEFAERQGLKIDPAAFAAADWYGDEKADLSGRYTASPFETPPPAPAGYHTGFMSPPPPPRMPPLRTVSPLFMPAPPVVEVAPIDAPVDTKMEAVPAAAAQALPPAAAPRTGERRGQRLADRLGQRVTDRQAFRSGERLQDVEQRVASLAEDKQRLETQCMLLQAEVRRLGEALGEAANQRDLWQLSASAAEDKLRVAQARLAVLDAAKVTDKGDKRFDRLRRFLARELHPDLAGENAAERVLREALFKRVWGKIEELG